MIKTQTKNKYCNKEHLKKTLIKKIILSLAVLITLGITINAQEEFKPHGQFEGKIFTNFNIGLTNGDKTKNFELKRAYFGYKYEFAPHFCTKLKLDVGGAEFITPEINNQYVFFKTAAVYYKKDRIIIGVGLQDTYQFKVEEKLWGKRYVLPAMPDYQKFNFSADIGVAVVYKLDNMDFDFSFFNGQGYKQFDADNAFRTSVGVTSYFLQKKLLLRVYGDYSTDSLHMASFTGLAGLKLKNFSFGAEYTFQKNYIYTDGHNRNGYSIFSQYNITPKLGLWIRIDGIWSDFKELATDNPDYDDNIAYTNKWLKRDGLYTYTGIEYVIVPKHLTTTINYRHHTPDGTGNTNSNYIYINLEVKW